MSASMEFVEQNFIPTMTTFTKLGAFSTETEIRTYAREVENCIKTSKDPETTTNCLKHLSEFLSPHKEKQEGEHTALSASEAKHILSVATRDTFVQNHFVRIATVLLDQLSVDWVSSMPKEVIKLYFDTFFLNGYSDNVILVLTQTIESSSSSYKQNKCVTLLEEYLTLHKLSQVFLIHCGLTTDTEDQLLTYESYRIRLIWDQLITCIASLPDKMANRLKSQNSDLFYAARYVPMISGDVFNTLCVARKYIMLSKSCCLEFISRLVGKLCITGYAEIFWGELLPPLSKLVREDFIWCRVCERVITGVPDTCLESVLSPIIKKIPWFGLMDKFLGDSVTKKLKIQLLLCTKFIFHKHFTNVGVLQNIIGYLGSSHTRHHLFIKLLKDVVQVWSDGSALKHMSYEQHLYLSQALFVCMAFITDRQKEENKDDVLRVLMPGVQVHIGSQDQKVRRLGMIMAEYMTFTMDPDGPKLKFEYEKDEEIATLLSLLKVPEDPGMDDVEYLQQMLCNVGLSSSHNTSSSHKDVPPVPPTQASSAQAGDDSELDSDDDLEPYDMSNDVKVSKVKEPKYIRDCMEGLICGDDPDKVEVSLAVAESLIRSHPGGLKEIAAEMAKILLHLSDNFSTPGFTIMRHKSLVALAVHCPVEVADYLTSQVYERNYNIKQRLDILEVLAAAAQELSRPVDLSAAQQPHKSPKIQEITSDQKGAESWQEIVQKRIESKTRRFAKGRSQPEPTPVANKFAPVAGHFFYPLMKSFDRQENTIDLLGEDGLVLGRLLYTLGMVMYAAANIPAARQMGAALLEFIWVLRFHGDMSVRQALLFAVAMVYMAVPAHILLTELQQEVYESKSWLEDVIERDPNMQCKQSAVQALVLLENIIKQEFQKEVVT